MPHTSTIEFRVRYAETDQMGVVYHANYLVWCELGRTEFIRVTGSTYADLERRGILLAVADANLRFHAAARYDDLVRVVTTLVAVRSRMVVFDYEIQLADTGQRLVTARTSLVCLDRGSKPAALPPDLKLALEAEITPAAGRP